MLKGACHVNVTPGVLVQVQGGIVNFEVLAPQPGLRAELHGF